MRDGVWTVRHGMFIMPFHDPAKPPGQCHDEDLEVIVRAERLGFGEFWVGEHHAMKYENLVMPLPEGAGVPPGTSAAADADDPRLPGRGGGYRVRLVRSPDVVGRVRFGHVILQPKRTTGRQSTNYRPSTAAPTLGAAPGVASGSAPGASPDGDQPGGDRGGVDHGAGWV